MMKINYILFFLKNNILKYRSDLYLIYLLFDKYINKKFMDFFCKNKNFEKFIKITRRNFNKLKNLYKF